MTVATRARESLQERALRLIRDGRLVVTLVDGEYVEAHVRGTDREHIVGYRRGGWFCDCEAHRFGRRCSHLAVVRPAACRTGRQVTSWSAARMRDLQDEANAVRNGRRSA